MKKAEQPGEEMKEGGGGGEGKREEEEMKVFAEQDERWRDVVQDARQHISHREAHGEYRAELSRAIAQYQILEDLVVMIHCSGSDASEQHRNIRNNRLRCLNQDLLRIIAEFAFDGDHGPIVEMVDRNIYQSYLHHCHYRKQQKQQQENTSAVQPFFVYIRKRPLLMYELERGMYNVVDINTYSLDTKALSRSDDEGGGGGGAIQDHRDQHYSNLVAVHDGKLARNGRILEMKHKVYAVSQTFSEDSSNEDVCQAVVEPLVTQVFRGMPATVLFYGQTGTGKTHTLLGTLKYIAARFSGLSVEITFYEIRGKKSYDLLNSRELVHLRSDDQENVHVRGCKVVRLDNLHPKEFMKVLNAALMNRSSKVTERNPVSSRSHAICTVQVLSSEEPEAGQDNVRRTALRLVDLAGSERNYETSNFTAADHRESADINYALMALKNCFRAYNASCTDPDEVSRVICFAGLADMHTCQFKPKLRAPYRASLLTRILRECFIRDTDHTTSVIATVSPSPTDLEHTINTLDHVTMMDPALDRLPIQRGVSVDVMIDGCAPPNTPVDSWSNRQLMAWLSHTDGGKFAQLVLPASMTGQALLELDMASLTELCAGQLREAREEGEGAAWVEEGETTKRQVVIAKRLFALLRREQNASLLRQSKVHQNL